MENLMILIKSGVEAEPKAVEGLRLSAAMLGMDQLPIVVFLDDGVECLRTGMLTDPQTHDFLQAIADLAGIYVLSESLQKRGVHLNDLDPSLEAVPLDIDGLAEMMAGCRSAATF